MTKTKPSRKGNILIRNEAGVYVSHTKIYRYTSDRFIKGTEKEYDKIFDRKLAVGKEASLDFDLTPLGGGSFLFCTVDIDADGRGHKVVDYQWIADGTKIKYYGQLKTAFGGRAWVTVETPCAIKGDPILIYLN